MAYEGNVGSVTTGGLVKTSTQVSPDQLHALEVIARERQISVAAIVREAIREYLGSRAQTAREALAA
jgi:predicted transcriptional regulator